MQKINAEYNDLKARVWNTHKSATGETYTSETATADRLRTAVASHDVTRESYYTNVLALFARALDEKRFRIDAEGRLHLPQETR